MNYINKVRLLFWCSLIFSFGGISCRDQEVPADELKLDWQDNQVRSVFIPRQWLTGLHAKYIDRDLSIVLPAPGAPAILGQYSLPNGFVRFEPKLPFTRGLKYAIYFKGRLVKEFEIPAPQGKRTPVVTAIYPSADSLPENLLKIYIGFSEHMREGVSAQHIVLVKDGVDTLSNVFLDLQPELWNNDRTLLTLWLNPGRIKRDLIPNQEEGPPLLPGHTYEILVRPGWQDATGDSIATTFQKKFVTIARDTLSPDINDWTIQAPKEGTLDPLIVHSQEPLDYGVWRNALFVLDKDAHEQAGAVEILDNDRTWRFTPYTKWKKGTYEIVVEPRVEDMAGNNLERLFDRDLQKPSAVQEGVVYPKNYVKYFEVR